MPHNTDYIIATPIWQNYGPGQIIKYSFLKAFPLSDYPNYSAADRARYQSGFVPLSPAQESAVKEILNQIASMTTVTFVEVTDLSATAVPANIRFGTATIPAGNNLWMPAGTSAGNTRVINDVYLTNSALGKDMGCVAVRLSDNLNHA